MRAVIDSLNRQNLTDMEFVEAVYSFVDSRYTSPKMAEFIYPARLFVRDINKIWTTTSYQPCDKQDFILKVMLLHSNRFSEEDIIEKT